MKTKLTNAAIARIAQVMEPEGSGEVKYYNNNPLFGDAGPHEGTIDQLCDEMNDLFAQWAEESDGEKTVEDLRTEFIDGLERV